VSVQLAVSFSNNAMTWATPQHTRTQVDNAGRILIADEGPPDDPNDPSFDEAWERYENALTIINNWRSSHSFPLNTFQVGLRRKARQITATPLVAQRIKRLSSIDLKLRRFKGLRLSQMQDIGGCRAVLHDAREVLELVDVFEKGTFKHKLDHIDDYIARPQLSGYRGVHLIYRYFSDRMDTYNGLKIEIQIRSPLQHAWATAVETVGTFIQQALKSSRGTEEWLRFFALMGTAIAHRERTPVVADTPTSRRQLKIELKKLAGSLDVEHRLRTYGAALQTLEQPSAKQAHYYLLRLDPTEHRVTVTGFKFGELERASEEYLEVERSIKGRAGSDAVLVSVESLDSLRRAYPNYFLDTDVFIAAVNRALR
jgi:ppGpp synthetase/RelA/SpoT-type nucleotidyltranferase